MLFLDDLLMLPVPNCLHNRRRLAFVFADHADNLRMQNMRVLKLLLGKLSVYGRQRAVVIFIFK